MRLRTRLITALSVGLLLLTTSALAQSNALRAAPAGTDVAVVLHGIGQIEPMVREHIESMERYGLDAPDLDFYLNELRKLSKRFKKARGPLVESMGLSATGSIAVYAQPGADGHADVTVVMDVKDRKALIKSMEWLLNLNQKSTKSGKAKVTSKKERLPGKGLLVSFEKPSQKNPLYLRFQGNLAVVSEKLPAIDRVQFAGGAPFPGSEALEGARIGFFAGLNTPGAIKMDMLPAAAAGVKTAQIHTLLREGRYEAKLDVEVEAEFEPFLSVLRPGAAGKAARASMSKLVSDRSDLWWRSSVDLKALETLASNLLGKGFEKVGERFEKRAGLPLTMVAKSMSGDQLVRCDGSFSNCVAVAGVLDAEGAEELVRHFFALAGDLAARDADHEISVETKGTSSDGDQRMFVTTFSVREDPEKKAKRLEKAHEYLRYEKRTQELHAALSKASQKDDGDTLSRLNEELQTVNREMHDKGLQQMQWNERDSIEEARKELAQNKGKKKKRRAKKNKQPFEPILNIHWGMTDKLLALGTTSHAIQSALKASVHGGAPGAEPILDDATFIAGYQARNGISSFIRQGIPAIRSLLPKDFIGGTIIRAIDGLLVLHDESVDGMSWMRVTPNRITLEGVAASLPTAGRKGYSAEQSAAYTEAMKLRYAGDLAESNRQLAKLALAHPTSPWGQKARGMVFRTDLAGIFFNLGSLSALMESPAGRNIQRQLGPMIHMFMRGF